MRPDTGIDQLRKAIALFCNCNETFNMRWHAEELIALYRAYAASDMDIPPDRWSDKQLVDALIGKVPMWSEAGEPL